ncbi:MAG: thiamine-phosphate kinase [candidate division Zixibacteria bacterium]|nr:thiamine-phosphate kinase [candidate division Zixibacteria bacterium]
MKTPDEQKKTKGLTVAGIGEFGLIDRIKSMINPSMSDNVIIGIGDDTAAIKIDENKVLLATCDIQVEDIHFKLDFISPYQLGKRAIAVNLSDIGSMGGKPTFALVSMALPKKMSVDNFDEVIRGMQDQMKQFSGSIIGGNLARTNQGLIIDIFMMGEAQAGRILTRSGAKAGNLIFTTGCAGSSAFGLKILQKFGKRFPAEYDRLVKKQLEPEPRIELACRLAESNFVTSMIDTSDGLGADLKHICDGSEVGAELYQDEIPVEELVDDYVAESEINKWKQILFGGEDYELLFTAPSKYEDQIKEISKSSGIPITKIGKITEPESGLAVIKDDGSRMVLDGEGWNHFR